jgi:hypothetical protein
VQPTEWFMITRNRLGESGFYLQSPFRSSYFLVGTISVPLSVIIIGMIAMKYWRQLDFVIALLLGLAVVSTFLLWMLTLRTHRIVHLLLSTGQIERLELGSDLDKILSVAAIVTKCGLLYVSLIVMSYLAVLAAVLRSR